MNPLTGAAATAGADNGLALTLTHDRYGNRRAAHVSERKTCRNPLSLREPRQSRHYS